VRRIRGQRKPRVHPRVKSHLRTPQMMNAVNLRLVKRMRMKNMVLVLLVQLAIADRDHFHTNAYLLDRDLQ
jgi:hypothetical protein